MFSKDGVYSLIGEIVKEMMADLYIDDDVESIRKKLNELEAEYAFRVHMENGLEEHSDLVDEINDLNMVYSSLIRKVTDEHKSSSNSYIFDHYKDDNDNDYYLCRDNSPKTDNDHVLGKVR